MELTTTSSTNDHISAAVGTAALNAATAASALGAILSPPTRMPIVAPLLSTYMDYRKFLLDYYLFKREQTKKHLRPYSYSIFAAAANIKSPNYLKMIIEGKRNLSEDMIGKFARALAFNKQHSEEFRLLVMFNQSADPAERNLLLKQLSEYRVSYKLKTGEIDKKSFEKLPSWVAWVLYAMIDQEGVSFKIEDLRNLLRGKVKADEIQSAMKSLIDAGEVVVDEEGNLKKTRALAESSEEIPVALIRKLQSQLMLLGLESLYQDPPTDREFGTITLALTKTEFEDIRFKLRQLRKQIHKDNSINRMNSRGDRVYQLNLQLFPVTNRS